MSLTITTLAERPELTGAFWELRDNWPRYITEDRVSWFHYGAILTTFPEYVLVATDADGQLMARALSVPFKLDLDGRRELPSGGWDQALLWAFSDHRAGREPDVVSAIEISVDNRHLGRGLSREVLAGMRDNARSRGFAELVAPLRPTGKHLEPDAPMSEYAWRTREDGLPHDPWIRTHVRAGAVIDSVASTSMVVTGSLADWRTWTGLPFDTSGPVVVPSGLNPARCYVEADYAVYVEPNVWVRHALTG